MPAHRRAKCEHTNYSRDTDCATTIEYFTQGSYICLINANLKKKVFSLYLLMFIRFFNFLYYGDE